MAQFNVEDIIGKTLFAKTSVPLKRRPEDNLEPIRTVQPGGTVGVVDSYILPKAGRNVNMYWMIKDGSSFVYAEHVAGRFNLTKLQGQGLQSVEEQAAEEAAANETLTDKIFRLVTYAGAGLFLLFLFKNNK